MMKVYLKSYAQRWKNIVVAVLCIMIALLLSSVLFHRKLNRISGQLNSYAQESYSLMYILNYASPLENEFLFPDADAQVYLDEGKTKRLTVSSVMKDSSGIYSSQELLFVNELDSEDVAISKNISEKYGIGVGESLYVEFPHSPEIMEYIIKKVVGINYDFTKPNIDNDIGIIYLGYDEGYEVNVQCKYIVFTEHTEAEILSEYPQIINLVINKSENENYVFKQGISILIFQCFFVVIAVSLTFIVFYAKSGQLLRRCYLKGMKKTALVWIPLAEKLVFTVLPAGVTLYAIVNWIPINSTLAELYYIIPLALIGLFCVGTVCVEMIKIRRKGG